MQITYSAFLSVFTAIGYSLISYLIKIIYMRSISKFYVILMLYLMVLIELTNISYNLYNMPLEKANIWARNFIVSIILDIFIIQLVISYT